MSWQGQLGTIVRYLINDIDPSDYKYSDQRIETSILVAGKMMLMSIDFRNTYSINVESCVLTPDPTDSDTMDDPFTTLTCLRAACMIIGGEIRSESGNAISIKDGPSAIDLRGVSQTLTILYKDLCDKYEKLLLEYKSTGGVGGTNPGEAILGPYSPGSYLISRNYMDHRSGGYFYS